MVIKKDGQRQFFDRNKLTAGLLKACEKRFCQRSYDCEGLTLWSITDTALVVLMRSMQSSIH